jgi:hypothetical protein
MKISINPEMYLDYGNLPDFKFRLEVDDEEYSIPELLPISEDTSALHIPTKDGKACRYQIVCQSRTAGNPNYAWGDFKSGWSSNAGFINVAFNKSYVDCVGYGLNVQAALEYLAENYHEPVVIAVKPHKERLEYIICPWHPRKVDQMFDSGYLPQTINPNHPDFVVDALHLLNLGPKIEKWKTCYQCEGRVSWLAPDGRCKKCTRMTAEEVRG